MKFLIVTMFLLFVGSIVAIGVVDLSSTGLNLGDTNLTNVDYIEGRSWVLPGDTADLQSKLDACTSGCVINLPCGSYDEVTIKYSNTQIIGSGICSLFSVSAGQVGIMIHSPTNDYIYGSVIRDIKLNPETTCTSGTMTGIEINYSKFNTIERVDITGLCGTGIKLDNWARHNTITENNIDMTYGKGIYITGGVSSPSNNNRFQNNQVQGRNGEAIQLQYYANSNDFVGNQLYSHNASVVEFNEDNAVASTYNSLVDNHILYIGQDNKYSAVYLNGSQYGRVTGNLILGNSGSERPIYGVYPNTGSNYNDIHGNRMINVITQYPNLRNTGTVNIDYNGEFTFLRVQDTTTGVNPGTDICIDSNNDFCQCGACA